MTDLRHNQTSENLGKRRSKLIQKGREYIKKEEHGSTVGRAAAQKARKRDIHIGEGEGLVSYGETYLLGKGEKSSTKKREIGQEVGMNE